MTIEITDVCPRCGLLIAANRHEITYVPSFSGGFTQADRLKIASVVCKAA